ncbi:acyl-ACP--UDP-N-acetylglucosamine O-acyltransferase [Halochromatium sp.]
MIHPTAVVDPSAQLDEDVHIGPYAIIGADVSVGRGTRIGPHAIVKGRTQIGQHNQVFQFASVGEDPQDKKYGGEPTALTLGDRNVIRESATIHRGTVQGGGETRIGNDNLFMAYTHVAHDCIIGDQVIMANAASLGGHVVIEDWAILGGFTIIHQFCRIGAHSFSAMGSVVGKDVPPYVTIDGHPAVPRGINSEGLKRRAFSSEQISVIRRAYRLLYLSNLKLEDATQAIAELAKTQSVVEPIVAFLRASARSIVR